MSYASSAITGKLKLDLDHFQVNSVQCEIVTIKSILKRYKKLMIICWNAGVVS